MTNDRPARLVDRPLAWWYRRDVSSRRKWARLVVSIGTVFLALWIPFNAEAPTVDRFSNVMVLAMAAASVSLLTGFSGQISVGQGAFFGVGAYTTAILVADHDWPYLATLLPAALLAFLVGVVVGLPALRVRGLNLALVTLALAVLFPQVIKRLDDLTGGTQGKVVPPFEAPEWTSLDVDQWRYFVILLALTITVICVRNIVKSRPGRALVAIRDDEIAAVSQGVHLARYKLAAFGLSAMIAGVAGGLSVTIKEFVDAGSYGLLLSIQTLVAAVLGGIATFAGPVVGALFLEWVPEWIKDRGWHEQLAPAFFGSALIVAMMLAPDGIVGRLKRHSATLSARFSGREDG
ncbi:MAG: branched-chain amino acid ABC transporter permease [Acidimicrobiales bacterium]|nr:MAG: branched-chain amino acid ABC transporter permease [Acidimicrobiales bacterium]